MNKSFFAASIVLAAAGLAPLAAQAQNIAVVNGKPVPKARVDAIVSQVQKQASSRGQQLPPDLDKLVRDKVVTDEILSQEAERRGLAASSDFKSQMEIARQSILIGLLSQDVEKKAAVSDAEVQTEYDKFKAQASGTEYKARHILVEKEDEAKAIVAKLKAGAKFEDLAKASSKDPGSAQNGGDLDFAAPSSYVPEFSQAMVALKKGEYTEVPVKTQFGYHIIKLEDTREAKLPPLAEVKPQIQQRLAQQ
ncbi:MAG TPA: peptidylprolyl isomerase, partial [Caldimonas sp.]